MSEEVLFEDERRQTRAEIADALRSIADKLEAGEPVSFNAGERSVTVEPSARPTFEVKVERETSGGASDGELSLELELEWREGASTTADDLTIE